MVLGFVVLLLLLLLPRAFGSLGLYIISKAKNKNVVFEHEGNHKNHDTSDALFMRYATEYHC